MAELGVIMLMFLAGLVVDEILDEAQSGNYDLAVIGAHGTRGWKRFLLDDVAHQIVSQIDFSVIIVPSFQNQSPER